MATTIHGAYVSPVAERRAALDRTELDDLIDELLRDVDEYRRQSPRRPRSRGSTGDRSRSGSACSRGESRGGGACDDATTGTSQNSAAVSTGLQLDIKTDEDVGLMTPGSSSAGSFNDSYATAGEYRNR